MNLNRQRMGEQNYQRRLEHGIRHLLFCIELYKIEHEAGRLFLHENPQSASSWQVLEVQELSQLEGVQKLVAHMCQYNMQATDEQGTGLVKTAHDLYDQFRTVC